VAENARIEALRRRVQKDPASIAFAQLAEECRRAGGYGEAAEICRAGLAIHPEYLSARVTLGRALLELNALNEAAEELTLVLRGAPENLAAVRGLAEIALRRGDRVEALRRYRVALSLAKNDPDLQEIVSDLQLQLAPAGVTPAEDVVSTHEYEEAPDEVEAVEPTCGTMGAFDSARPLVAALEQWLTAIHVTRAERHA
jgi:tetratricopeptide (TPR) repeat protein